MPPVFVTKVTICHHNHRRSGGLFRGRAHTNNPTTPVDPGLAADFYASFPEEIDELIQADERAAEEVRRQARRREQLLSP